MYFLSDASVASFAKQKKQDEKPSSLREKIIGRTNAGKAFRVGAVASAVGLGGLAYAKRKSLGNMLKNPKDYYSYPAGENYQEMIWQKWNGDVPKGTKRPTRKARREEYDARKWNEDPNWSNKQSRFKPDPQKDRSFIGTGRKVDWGRVTKTIGIGGTALAIPTGAAYLAGDKKDKEDIKNRAEKVAKGTKSTLRDARTWVNTLHRVSR